MFRVLVATNILFSVNPEVVSVIDAAKVRQVFQANKKKDSPNGSIHVGTIYSSVTGRILQAKYG